MFRTGDRVRVRCDNHERTEGGSAVHSYEYGYIETIDDTRTHAVVLLDDDLNPRRVELVLVSTIDIATLELCLDGNTVGRSGSDEAAVRDELVVLWQDEAEQAGIDIERIVPLAAGTRADLDTWALAELHAGGVRFLLRARFDRTSPQTVRVHAVPHYPEN
jgi:hypothetical protein